MFIGMTTTPEQQLCLHRIDGSSPGYGDPVLLQRSVGLFVLALRKGWGSLLTEGTSNIIEHGERELPGGQSID